jgi:hypothetical protein
LDFRQWYYSNLKPWTHYVPVKANLSDLHEQIDWCRTNTEECKRIAAMGQAFAMARTYETELESGVRRLAKSYKAGMLRATIAS